MLYNLTKKRKCIKNQWLQEMNILDLITSNIVHKKNILPINFYNLFKYQHVKRNLCMLGNKHKIFLCK